MCLHFCVWRETAYPPHPRACKGKKEPEAGCGGWARRSSFHALRVTTEHCHLSWSCPGGRPGAHSHRIHVIRMAVRGVGVHSAKCSLCSYSCSSMCSNPSPRSLLRTQDTPAPRLTPTAASHRCPLSTSLTSSNSDGALSPVPLSTTVPCAFCVV